MYPTGKLCLQAARVIRALLDAADARACCVWDGCDLDAVYCPGHAKEYMAPLADLLMRLRAWDMMDVAADGPYWRKQIDAAIGIKPAEPIAAIAPDQSTEALDTRQGRPVSDRHSDHGRAVECGGGPAIAPDALTNAKLCDLLRSGNLNRAREYLAADRLEAAERQIAAMRAATGAQDVSDVTRPYIEALETAERESAAKDARLRECIVALDDWLHTYAEEMCKEEYVKESYRRIADNGGTLAYIARLQAANRATLAAAQAKGE